MTSLPSHFFFSLLSLQFIVYTNNQLSYPWLMQTFGQSAFESLVSVLIGLLFGFITHVLVFPVFGIHVSPVTNLYIALACSVVSFLQRLLVRLYFERFHCGRYGCD